MMIRVYLKVDVLDAVVCMNQGFRARATAGTLIKNEQLSYARLSGAEYTALETDCRNLQVDGMQLRYDDRMGLPYLEANRPLEMSATFVEIGNDTNVVECVTIKEEFDGEQLASEYFFVNHNACAEVERIPTPKGGEKVVMTVRASTLEKAVKLRRMIRRQGSNPQDVVNAFGRGRFLPMDV